MLPKDLFYIALVNLVKLTTLVSMVNFRLNRYEMFNVDKMTKTNYFSLNSFLLYVPYVYPLKTTENQMFPGALRGCKSGTLAIHGLIIKLFVLRIIT